MYYGTVNGGEFVAEMAKKGGVAALTNPTSSLRRYNHNTVIQLIYYVMQSLMPQVAMEKSDGQRRETSLCGQREEGKTAEAGGASQEK